MSSFESNIILYRSSDKQTVLYDARNNAINDTESLDEEEPSPLFCPTCRRPFHFSKFKANYKYAQNEYFRILHENTQESYSEHLPDSAFNQNYYKNFFKEISKLGRGLRGSVFLCKHVLNETFLGDYAVKKVPVGDNNTWLVRMLKEVKILEKFHHPNIISYKHAWLEMEQPTVFGPKIPCLFILMELATGGNLEDFVLKNNLTHNEMIDIMIDITRGVDHLHRHGIIHRDLKPQNLLLQYNDKHYNILISDFGECESLDEIKSKKRTGATGTLEFMAPELLEHIQGEYTDIYDVKSDVWSLGMVFLYIYQRSLPFQNLDDIEQLRNDILSLNSEIIEKFITRSNSRIRTLIKTLLNKQPAERPSASIVLDLLLKIKSYPEIEKETRPALLPYTIDTQIPRRTKTDLLKRLTKHLLRNVNFISTFIGFIAIFEATMNCYPVAVEPMFLGTIMTLHLSSQHLLKGNNRLIFSIILLLGCNLAMLTTSTCKVNK
ncbi:Protein kinase, catalytic domain-containing protein [Rozella allomycis CSF55]|uniref:non-specific serine/threonine protein kinase n=1 Tax=Rozella allomycis (strain CSF55) TaxID=988480 RepID=A0A075AQH6_ROZAC|nr:Protein kinase, catalytic domain-containing protein [Rozella allomycis CSF55]|eukprot:EPZ32501.1 Protein kinase, catalytic domain-containing protein [Rozella allomycis CSF55]